MTASTFWEPKLVVLLRSAENSEVLKKIWQCRFNYTSLFFSSYYFFTVHAVSSGCRNIYLFRRNGTGLPKSHAPTGKKNISTKACWVSQSNGTIKQARGFSYLLEPHKSTKRVSKTTRVCPGEVDMGPVERDGSLSFPPSPGQSSRSCNLLSSSGDFWGFGNSAHKISTALQPNCKLGTKELHDLLKLNCKITARKSTSRKTAFLSFVSQGL